MTVRECLKYLKLAQSLAVIFTEGLFAAIVACIVIRDKTLLFMKCEVAMNRRFKR